MKTYSHARRNRGFTLLEIMIVVILIGLVVAFAANRILGGSDRAKFNLTKTAIQSLAGKIEQFEMDTGTLPPTLDALVSAPGGSDSWLGPYAKTAELKDPWGTPFEYRVPGATGRYDLISYGSDRQPGGDSTAQDIRNE